MNSEDLDKLKVPELRKELKTYGLATTGNKAELLQRLGEYLKSTEKQILAGNNEDLDDDLAALEENVLGGADEDLNSSVTSGGTPAKTTATPKLKLTPSPVSTGPESTPQLNTSSETKEAESKDSAQESDGEEKKKITLKSTTNIAKPGSTDPLAKLERAKKFNTVPALSETDKKDIRAQRFGIEGPGRKSGKITKVGGTKDPEMLKKRAERFGLPLKGSNEGAAVPLVVGGASSEKLKSRAERFGITEDTAKVAVNQAEVQEKRLKRKERFGEISVTPAEVDSKKAKRAERFGPATVQAEIEIKKAKRAEKFQIRAE